MCDTPTRLRDLAFVAPLLLLASTGTAQGTDGLSFTDITGTAGVGVPELLTESLAWGDYDDDGDPDLYLTNIGANNLFKNVGGDLFEDVTAATGTGHEGWGVGTAFGDLDDDGDLDLWVTNFQQQDALYRNDGPIGVGGEHVFTDVAVAAGILFPTTSRGMAFLDYNRDGLLDVYCNAIGPNVLYRNNGGLSFTNVALTLGVDADDQGVGTVVSDIDDNGWVDIFTGNRSDDPNALYRNTGGTFQDITAAAGITATGLGMGVHAFDYDNDLDMDLYWTCWPAVPNALYDNDGDGNFTDVAAATGTLDPDGWGISNNVGDVDNDGFQDFFVTNGFDPGSTANVLFHNTGRGTFADATGSLEGGGLFDGRGAAFADRDGDGDLDLCVTSNDNRLWRNDSVIGHWIVFDLRGSTSTTDAIGARIEVTAGDLRTVQEVSGGAGRGSFNDLPVEFGLGTETAVDRVVIRWPDGSLQVLEDLAPRQTVVVMEDDTWFDENLGNPGTGGVEPRLAGLGSLAGGTAATLALRDGLPGASGFLVFGIAFLSAPFKGGTLVPTPDLVAALPPVPADGELSLSFRMPNSVPAGTTILFQEWFIDAGAAFGFSASNGISGTTP